MFFSDYFGVEKSKLKEYGALDISLDCDLPLFIDPMLIFNSDKEEYKELHKGIVKYFNFLYEKSNSGLTEKEILAWFNFSEVPNNWLGYSLEGNSGLALGKKYALFLHSKIGFVIDNHNITKGQHIEKSMLLYEGTGRDKISDLTVNLIKGFLCEYTQKFAREYLSEDCCEDFYVEKAYFNYDTESFVSEQYYLPSFINRKGEKEFVLLTPLDLLRKEEQTLNKKSFISNFYRVRDSIDNPSLRTYVDNYIGKAIKEYQENQLKNKKKPNENTIRRIEKDCFLELANKELPELYDYFIKLQEDNPEELRSICDMERLDFEEFVSKISVFANAFNAKQYIKVVPKTSREEARNRLKYLKHMIEDCDLYKELYNNGERIAKEENLQRLFRLVWCDTTRKIDAEANNGRGAADFIISNGRDDQVVVEFKLASNSKLSHVFTQVKIYEAANESKESLIAVFCFTEAEINAVNSMLKQTKKDNFVGESIFIIDCRNDNKKSASIANKS